MALVRGLLWLVVLFGLTACPEVVVTENSAQSVTVHYYGIASPSLDDATAVAAKMCATHGEGAHLRSIDDITTMEHYAHFTCVGR